jgi:hypothetical protein
MSYPKLSRASGNRTSYPKLSLAPGKPHFATTKYKGNTMPTPLKATIQIRPISQSSRDELHLTHTQIWKNPAPCSPHPKRIATIIRLQIQTGLKLSYGSKFKPASTLEFIFKFHLSWQMMKTVLTKGS